MFRILLIIVILLIIFFGTFGIGYIKGYYHFKYLKRLYPKKYEKYKNFHSAWHIIYYNRNITLLILPWFKRSYFLEDEQAERLAKKVYLYVIINVIFYCALLLLPILSIYTQEWKVAWHVYIFSHLDFFVTCNSFFGVWISKRVLSYGIFKKSVSR